MRGICSAWLTRGPEIARISPAAFGVVSRFKRRSRLHPTGNSTLQPPNTDPCQAGTLQQSCDRDLYDESVQAHWTESTVGEHGEVVLEGLRSNPASQSKCWWSRRPHEWPRPAAKACLLPSLSSSSRSNPSPSTTGTQCGDFPGQPHLALVGRPIAPQAPN